MHINKQDVGTFAGKCVEGRRRLTDRERKAKEGTKRSGAEWRDRKRLKQTNVANRWNEKQTGMKKEERETGI